MNSLVSLDGSSDPACSASSTLVLYSTRSLSDSLISFERFNYCQSQPLLWFFFFSRIRILSSKSGRPDAFKSTQGRNSLMSIDDLSWAYHFLGSMQLTHEAMKAASYCTKSLAHTPASYPGREPASNYSLLLRRLAWRTTALPFYGTHPMISTHVLMSNS